MISNGPIRSLPSAIAWLLFAATTTFAQAPRAFDPRTITVTGDAEVRVAPDEAVLGFGIETSSMDIEEARSESERKVKELLALTQKMGIQPQHVQTAYLSVEPRYNYPGEGKPREFLGYFTRRDVVIVLKDLTKFESLLAGALKLGVNYVGQAQLRVSELRKHRDQARQLAIRAAREKAAALAGELGARIGKPLAITEEVMDAIPFSIRGGRTFAQNALGDEGGGGDGGGTLSPGQIPISARVTVVFELE